MELKSARIICFSPTGNTRKILQAVSDGLGITEPCWLDITNPEIRRQRLSGITEDIVIIGTPVYYKRIPQPVLDYLLKLKGSNTPLAAVVTYGNRGYGDSLTEIKEITTRNQFHLVGAAAFIGEHSFSTEQIPIAVNRPDGKDINQAEEFGNKIKQKLKTGQSVRDIITPDISGRLTLPKRPRDMFTCTPERKFALCTNCGHCVEICPMGAIDSQDLSVDKDLCIRCCACIKGCPQNAIIMNNTKFKLVSRLLSVVYRNAKEPVEFL